MATSLVPYLTLDGTSREVMEYYHSIFGGKLDIQTFGEAGMANDEAVKDRVIHAQLSTDEFTLMASDTHPTHSPAVVMGNNVNLSLVGTDAERLTAYFQKLAEGGTVEMPLEKQFWGDVFGACEDRYGIHWMVNISSEAAA